MAERSIAEIMGWKFTPAEPPDPSRHRIRGVWWYGWRLYTAEELGGAVDEWGPEIEQPGWDVYSPQPCVDDMLAWLWEHACSDCLAVYVPPRNAAPFTGDDWTNVVTVDCCTFRETIVERTMHAALAAAVRQVAEQEAQQ